MILLLLWEQKGFYYDIVEELKAHKLDAWTESRAEARVSFASLYGGFFFIGTFLSALFVVAAALIIYYKQISEGYDDRERFLIMQKVGMERREVRASIRSQVLMVFFLPLAVAWSAFTVLVEAASTCPSRARYRVPWAAWT